MRLGFVRPVDGSHAGALSRVGTLQSWAVVPPVKQAHRDLVTVRAARDGLPTVS